MNLTKNKTEVSSKLIGNDITGRIKHANSTGQESQNKIYKILKRAAAYFSNLFFPCLNYEAAVIFQFCS